MKCEICGINEAVVFLREHADGQLRERRLCPRCARELGLDIPEDLNAPETETPEGETAGPGEGFFAMPVAWVIAAPRPAPRRSAPESREDAPGEKEKPRLRRPTPVDAALNRRRERNILRERMDQAVRAEDYAEAARLRDALRSMESGTA